MIERAEIIREKGTNRSRFYRGAVDKYTWVDVGSSYLPSELSSAFLLARLEMLEAIHRRRQTLHENYVACSRRSTRWACSRCRTRRAAVAAITICFISFCRIPAAATS